MSNCSCYRRIKRDRLMKAGVHVCTKCESDNLEARTVRDTEGNKKYFYVCRKCGALMKKSEDVKSV